MTPVPRKPIPFGRYLLVDRLSIGGLAEVWRGITRGVGGFDRLVAIKRLLPYLAEDEAFISMLLDESRVALRLNHPNIAQVFEVGRLMESYFIAMEYVSGKDIGAIVDRCRKKGEPAPIPLSCYAIGQCCAGLDYAHRKKDGEGRELVIIHREVSPQNVLVSYEGEVKLIDWTTHAAGRSSCTGPGILRGKFRYMSPEQVRGLPLDRRSDVFLAGVCLYEMLTGECLFVGESDFSVLEKVRDAVVPLPRTCNPEIPAALEKVVMKALAKDPGARYQFASELGDALQPFMIRGDVAFGRQDLSQHMKATFAEEYERESRRLLEYRDLKAPEGPAPPEPEARSDLLKSLEEKWGV